MPANFSSCYEKVNSRAEIGYTSFAILQPRELSINLLGEKMSRLTLGLALGPRSIGWALVRDGSTSELVDIGVRVFPEGVDAFGTSKEKSRNEDRRIARDMRRQVRRRVARRKKLIDVLIESGLWPPCSTSQDALYQLDPYELRRRGLTEKLEPYEFGRVLLHLNQRRGFLSNRKKDRAESEAKGILAEIKDNERKREEGGFETIGAYLADKAASLGHRNREKDDHVRNRHLARQQYFEEFDLLWSKQNEYHPNLLTNQLRWGKLGPAEDNKKAIKPHHPIAKNKAQREGLSDLEAFGLHGLMFFQRPMYWPRSAVGLCELEPKQKRCPRADRHAERFRLLQEVNNLRYADPDSNEECPISAEQRILLLEYLATREKATFDQIRKKLGFLESVKFNLERGKRSSIKGAKLDYDIAIRVGKQWHQKPEEDKDAIVKLLRENQNDDDAVVESLINDYNFDSKDAKAALNADLPTGYAMLSRVAIDKLLPHLEEGMIYQSQHDPERSALHSADYLRRDELQRRLFDYLPDLSRTTPTDCKLGDLPNPVVKRALVELRKVVNAIIREYGKPAAVHVEMTRTLRMGPKARSEYNSRIRKIESAREEAAKAIRNAGERPSRDSIIKYRLWQEQSHECIYCGKPISQQQLFGGTTDVDHILPYSRCLDDSQANKVVCHRECYYEKGQQTPYEWLANSDSEKYAEVCQRAGDLLRKGLLPYPKYRRFLQIELILDNFIARQLIDTGYITRATVEYLQLLFDKPSDVLGLKGQLTAELRWQWGLGTILSELPDSPAWLENADMTGGEKNRADHRHHAIDALVVALTNRSRLLKLTDLYKRGGAKTDGEILPDPWDDFRNSVSQAVAKINVSHRVERKVRGALHEETQYGPTKNANEWAVRKPVADLTAAEIERIRDPGIRRIVENTLNAAGLEVGRGMKPNAKKMKEVLSNLSMPSGVPIKRVRIIKPEKTIAPLRDEGVQDQTYVKPGSTHHLCVFEFEEKGKRKREAVFVTMLEATQRIKRGKPVINRKHPDRPDARFVMSLSGREVVVANWKGTEKLLLYKTAASTQGQIYFADISDARRSSDQKKYVATANSLDAQKVTIDPLGRIRWAND